MSAFDTVMILAIFFELLVFGIWAISKLQDLSDVIDVLANPFLFEKNDTFPNDMFNKKRKATHHKNAKATLKGK